MSLLLLLGFMGFLTILLKTIGPIGMVVMFVSWYLVIGIYRMLRSFFKSNFFKIKARRQ